MKIYLETQGGDASRITQRMQGLGEATLFASRIRKKISHLFFEKGGKRK
jgi:hypothetical protein